MILFKKTFILLLMVISLQAQENLRLAITDFKNITGDLNLDYLEKAVPEILITNLAGLQNLVIVERDRIQEIYNEMALSLSGVINENEASEVGKMVGAENILVGSIIKVGRNFRIDSRMVEVSSGEVQLAEKMEWISDDDIIHSIDQLAGKIARKLFNETLNTPELIPEGPDFSETENPIAIETTLDNSFRHIDETQPVHFKIDLYSREHKGQERIPLNIALVMDKSGSMAAENKLEHTKQAAEFVVRNLSNRDLLSIVEYSTDCKVLLSATKVINKSYILGLIKNISEGGSTNMSRGMLAGYNEVSRFQKPGQVNRILLLSDGIANRGITDPGKLQQMCMSQYAKGISISSFGVGAEFNEDLMLNMAEYGNGNYYYIDQAEKIPLIFARELHGLLAVTAQDVVIKINTQPGTKIENVYGHLYKQYDDYILINIGDVYSNEHRTIVVELYPGSENFGIQNIAEVIVNYNSVLGNKKEVSESKELSVKYTKDKEVVTQNINPVVQQVVTLNHMTNQMDKTIRLVDKGEIKTALKELDREIKQINSEPEKYNSHAMKKQILTTRKYNAMASKFLEISTTERKKIQKAEKFKQYQLKKKGSTKNSNEITPKSEPTRSYPTPVDQSTPSSQNIIIKETKTNDNSESRMNTHQNIPTSYRKKTTRVKKNESSSNKKGQSVSTPPKRKSIPTKISSKPQKAAATSSKPKSNIQSKIEPKSTTTKKETESKNAITNKKKSLQQIKK